MDDHNFEPYELTPEYLLGRINLLEGAVEALAQVCSSYMPPDGQEALATIGNKLGDAVIQWGKKNKAAWND